MNPDNNVNFPQTLFKNKLLFLALLVWSLLPSLYTPWFDALGSRFSLKDLLLLVLGFVYLVAFLGARVHRNPKAKELVRLFGVTAAVLVYASISMLWSGLDEADFFGMAFTLLCSFSAVTIGYQLITSSTKEQIERVLWALTLFITAVCIVYAAESLLSLGLRSTSTQEFNDFGIMRIRGPLFSSATGHFVIVPALGFILDKIFSSKKLLPLHMACGAILCLTLLGLGSRAGLIVFGVFAVLCVVLQSNIKRTLTMLALIVFISIPGFLVINAKADLSRLNNLEDQSRLATHNVAIETIKNRSIDIDIVGSGYGSVWSWYNKDVGTSDLRSTGEYFQLTDYGFSLYHPHSTFLVVATELGLVGVVVAFIFAAILLRSIFGTQRSLLLYAVIASSLSAFFDLLILFKSNELNTLWWIFAFGALALVYTKTDKSETEEPLLTSTSARP